MRCGLPAYTDASTHRTSAHAENQRVALSDTREPYQNTHYIQSNHRSDNGSNSYCCNGMLVPLYLNTSPAAYQMYLNALSGYCCGHTKMHLGVSLGKRLAISLDVDSYALLYPI